MAAWRAWLRRDGPGLVLAALAMAWRAKVRVHSLVSFDAGLVANGVRDYDIPSGQPHPPGYPLAILAGRIVDLVVHDPVMAMVWLSIVWTGVTVFLLWKLGEEAAGRWAGTAAALLFIVSPVALFNGSVGLTYSGDAALGAAAGLATWRAGERPTRRRLLVLGAVLAIAVGVRPSGLFFIAPLGLWPALRAPSVRDAASRTLWVGLAAVPIVIAWLVPMVVFGGGLHAILSANRVQSRTVVFSDTALQDGWPIVDSNLDHLQHYAKAELRGLPWLVAATVIAWWAVGRRAASRLVRRGAHLAGFVALWLVPALLFYVFVYVGWPVYPPGYLMVVLPAAALALAAPFAAAARRVPAERRPVVATLCVLLFAIPLVHAPDDWRHATEPNRRADDWADSWDGLREAFPPESSALVVGESWPHVKLREPDYLSFVRAIYDYTESEVYIRGIASRDGHDDPRWFDLLAADPDAAVMHPIPPWVTRLVLHEDHPYTGHELIIKPTIPLHATTLASGRVVHWFEPDPSMRAIESYFPAVDPAWSEARLAAQLADGSAHAATQPA